MKLTHCGFIFKGSGMHATEHAVKLASPSFAMSVRGVADLEEAVLASKVLVEEGVQVIELCGGFDENMTRRIIDAIGGAVPVAAVAYFPEELAKLERFLKEEE